MNDVEAMMLLACAVEPASVRANQLLTDYSPSELIARSHLLQGALHSRIEEINLAHVQGQMRSLNARFMCRWDSEWPAPLNDLALLTPMGIWLRGRDFKKPAIALVGARSCSIYGEDIAMTLAADVAQAGVSVISGGALGIDAAAHRGALAVGGHTVAVLAGGVDQLYPQSNSKLFQSILESGTLMSESPPQVPPVRHRFLIRNRLIAALGDVTVVVEARHRSGAIATASHAAALNRDVAAVPGPVSSATSTGCHALIRDGAVLVTTADDILELCVTPQSRICVD